ncbi:hypothetical protein BC834DRAFT_975821 [Gloeopeniophorella convolvens]|nr:hypothetical protein BC834DRAFT_975821 [Gloeopeniophorella convolvens]
MLPRPPSPRTSFHAPSLAGFHSPSLVGFHTPSLAVPTPTPLRRVSAPSQGSQIIGRRRARPDEDEDDEDDELVQAPARTRSDTMFSSQDNKYWELFQLLLSFRPNLIQECANQGENGPMSIADDIDVGRSKTRNVIIFAVKKTILDWYDFGPTGPHVDNKEFRFPPSYYGTSALSGSLQVGRPCCADALITHDPKYPPSPETGWSSFAKDQCEELLDWWNLQLFGYSTEIDNGDLSAEIKSDPMSVLSLMLAQLMAGEEEPDDDVEMRPSEEPGDEEDESMEPDRASGSA